MRGRSGRLSSPFPESRLRWHRDRSSSLSARGMETRAGNEIYSGRADGESAICGATRKMLVKIRSVVVWVVVVGRVWLPLRRQVAAAVARARRWCVAVRIVDASWRRFAASRPPRWWIAYDERCASTCKRVMVSSLSRWIRISAICISGVCWWHVLSAIYDTSSASHGPRSGNRAVRPATCCLDAPAWVTFAITAMHIRVIARRHVTPRNRLSDISYANLFVLRRFVPSASLTLTASLSLTQTLTPNSKNT